MSTVTITLLANGEYRVEYRGRHEICADRSQATIDAVVRDIDSELDREARKLAANRRAIAAASKANHGYF